MIAIVNQSKVVLPVLAVTQTGELSSDIVSGTVRVYTVDSGVQTDVLVSTPLVNIVGSYWSYEWEPTTLDAGQYFIEYSLTDNVATVTYATENLFVMNDAAVSQAVIQGDISNVQSDITAMQVDVTSIQTDVTAVQTDVTSIQTDVTAVQTDVTSIQTDVTAVQTDVTAVQTDVTAVQTDVTAVQSSVVGLQTDITFLRQVESGRWEITSDNQMIIYDSDGTTPLLTFSLLDADGEPTTQNPFERVPV